MEAARLSSAFSCHSLFVLLHIPTAIARQEAAEGAAPPLLIRTGGMYGGRRKSAKEVPSGSGFSFLADFPTVSTANRKICYPDGSRQAFIGSLLPWERGPRARFPLPRRRPPSPLRGAPLLPPSLC